MKSVYLIRFMPFLFGASGLFFNVIESVYVTLFNKPIFVHLYLVKKKLPIKKKVFLETSIQFYQKLNEKEKRYFEHRLVNFFRRYKIIERGDFNLTPEEKVLIASSYIKLTFGMRKYLTSTFNKIIVYPNSFYSIITKQYHKGEFNPTMKCIVFSWEDFLLGDMVTNDNINLGIHEFTHALTFHGKKSNDVSAKIFKRLYEDIGVFMNDKKNSKAIIDSNYFRDYAHTNQLEFLAVVMEHFFETPHDLKQKFPALFNKIELMLNFKSTSRS